MNYNKARLLALRPHGANDIWLVMRPHSGRHPKPIEFDTNNFNTVPITSYNAASIRNVSIDLINCQSICNKSDEISHLVRDMDLDALVITET